MIPTVGAIANRPANSGELLLVDSGAQYLDGTTDITRTMAMGDVGDDERAAYTRVLQGMINISRLRFPRGIAGRDIDAIARMNLWNAGQNSDAASEAGKLLSVIDPNSSCFADAKSLSDQIAKPVLELDKREWDFEMKQYNDQISLEKATIQAARDIGVAYGENQPQTVTYNYDVWGWW